MDKGDQKLTHINEQGEARMVDVSQKDVTVRTARAQAIVTMQAETMRLILAGEMPKGDVLPCARIAGIMAAKKTSELIPMCHPIPIEQVEILVEPVSETALRIESKAVCSHKTGIEMEALTAVSVAALTIYDMCKAVDRSMRIDEVMLLYKSGGKSGVFERETTVNHIR